MQEDPHDPGRGPGRCRSEHPGARWSPSSLPLPRSLSLSLFWLLALVMSISSLAQAAPPAVTPAPPAGGATVEQLIAAALAQRRTGHDDAALPLLQRAYARAHTPRAAAQLGFVEQALGLWPGAEAHLFEALTARRDPWIRQNVGLIEESLETAHTHVGLVRVDVDIAGADVFVDGALIGRSPLGAGVRVTTGERRVEVRAAGFRTVVETPTVAAGKTASLIVHMNRVPAPPPPLRARAAPATR